MSEPIKKTVKVYTEAQRVTRVFRSQGRAVRLAAHLPEKFAKRVAAMCSPEGVVVVRAGIELVKILREMGQENKATVEGLTEDKE